MFKNPFKKNKPANEVCTYKGRQYIDILNVQKAEEIIKEEYKVRKTDYEQLEKKYEELYPNAIIAIAGFADHGDRVSFFQTVQTEHLYLMQKKPSSIYELGDAIRHMNAINNDFQSVVLRVHSKKKPSDNNIIKPRTGEPPVDFAKSDKEYSYYHLSDPYVLYLCEKDWNTLSGETK